MSQMQLAPLADGSQPKTRGRRPHRAGVALTHRRQCRVEGCTEFARPIQGAVYCEAHATDTEGKPPRQCRYPGCEEPARQVQGARYCIGHATSLKYERTDRAMTLAAVCSCGQTYERRRRALSPTTTVWYDFCPDCRQASPLSLDALGKHRVPPDTVRHWLSQASQLQCDLCGARLSSQRGAGGVRAYIDHDHACCPGHRSSCGECVRGVLCPFCNGALGQYEALVRRIDLASIDSYLQGRRP